jgi:hypothetical protein
VSPARQRGRVAVIGSAPLRPVRDFVLDHTPLLQKTVGEKSPQEILQQLDEIDTIEARFRAITPT